MKNPEAEPLRYPPVRQLLCTHKYLYGEEHMGFEYSDKGNAPSPEKGKVAMDRSAAGSSGEIDGRGVKGEVI